MRIIARDDPEETDPRAVLDGRTPGRISARAIAGIAISSLCAFVLLTIDLTDGDGATSFLGGLGLAILPVPVLIALVLALDPLEPEPWPALAFAFLWGAGVAVLGAAILNTVGLHYVTAPIFGTTRGQLVTAAIGAPVIEESLKGAVLFAYLSFYRQELDELNDGIVYAAMVAIGFAMMENITYYMRAAVHHELVGVFLLRGIIAPFGHPLFTSMTGLGVSYAALNRGRARVWAPAAGLAVAMLLHGIWNLSTAFGFAGLGIAYGIDLCVLAILVAVVVAERRALTRLIRTVLTPYTATGLVTERDIQMLGSPPLRRRARRWARLRGGTAAARAMGHYQLAATELVLAHKMAQRGLAEPSWATRRMTALLDVMRLSLEAFREAARPPHCTPWAAPGQSAFHTTPD